MANAEEAISFGSLLRRHRIALGLTQESLAERTGLGTRSIQHLEGGAHLPHRETVDRLLRVLGLTGDARKQFEQTAQPRSPRQRDELSLMAREVSGDPTHQPAPSYNLPAALTSFVGRQSEVTAVSDLVRTGQLVTLVGVGGCGKTRLALAVAERIRPSYPEGVWLVELAPLSDPALIPKAISQALGVQEQPQQPLPETLRTYLHGRRLLLLLDNCEHLIAGCARLADDLLRTCPLLTVFATSREALGIPGEVTWRVPSLTVPDDLHDRANQHDPVARLLSAEAAQLFWQRARTADPGFAVTPENAEAITEICWRLDGIPLAIELAAARIKVLSAEQVAARLTDRFQLLTGGSRTALPRQQTLRATLDWSYNLLSDPERALFRRLSVFAGGFSLEAAEAVCSGVSVLDLLSQLVDKSLVQVEKRRREARYHLLETVRQYGHERLVEAEEAAAAWNRLAAWCLGLTERAQAGLIGPQQLDWLERLELEHDNLRAALSWCQTRALEVGIRLAGNLWRFWRMRGFFAEGWTWLDSALARATEGSTARATALVGAGILAYERGDVQKAKSLLEEGVAWWRQAGEKGPLGHALHDLGLCLLMIGEDAERINAVWEESLALLREVDDQRGVAWSLTFLGGLAAFTRDFGKGREFSEQAVQLFKRIDDAWSLSQAWGNLGGVLLMQGDTQRAREVTEEQLVLARRLGNRFGIGAALYGLAQVALSENDVHQAELRFAESLRMFQSIGSRGTGDVLRDLGTLAVRGGETSRGVRLLAAGATGGSPNSGSWLRFWESLEAGWEASLAAAKSTLGEEVFASAWAEGQAMSLDQAVDYALEQDGG